MKWPLETPGLCCVARKVFLNEITDPPEPLNSLINNTYDHSKVFLDNIRKYNSAFQMTSFCATEIRHGNFIPTFIIQGQLYHAVGSLLPSTNEESKFLQIYFMGNEELDRRLFVCHHANREILNDLQEFLHGVLSMVHDFEAIIETLPPNSKSSTKFLNIYASYQRTDSIVYQEIL
jgi:hypothetical protein